MKSRFIILFNQLCALGIVLFMAGCGGSGTSSSAGTGAIAVKVAWQRDLAVAAKAAAGEAVKASIPPGAVTVRLSVSGPGMTTVSKDFAVADGKGTVSGVPVGVDRLLTAQGLDANGVVISSGMSTKVSVLEGQTSDAGTIDMKPVSTVTTASLVGNWTVTEQQNTIWNMTCAFIADGTGSCNEGNGAFSVTWTYNQTTQAFDMKLTNSGGGSMGGTISGSVDSFYVDGHWSSGNPGYFHWVRQAASTYSISGTVTYAGAGLSGVTVSAGSYSATTQSDGSYTINGVPNGLYTLTASKSGYSITPASTQVTVNNANLANQNFTATLTPNSFDISGSITLNGTGLSGVTVSAGSYTATTLASGAYTISGVPNGSYTLTPAKSGYSFSPASATATVSNTSVTGQNFTATAAGGGGATGSSAYFPTTVGNTWTYETNDGTNTTPYTYTVSKVSGSTFTLQTTWTYSSGSLGTVTNNEDLSIINGAYYITSLSSLNSWSDGSNSGTSTVTGTYTAPGSMFLPGEMAPGATTSSSTTGTLNSTSTSGTYSSSGTTISEESGSYTVAGTESVTVPAGTFPAALKINYTRTIKQTTTTSGSTSSVLYTSTSTGTYWYVSGIGWVKSTGTATGTMTSNGTTYPTSTSSTTSVLKSYSVK